MHLCSEPQPDVPSLLPASASDDGAKDVVGIVSHAAPFVQKKRKATTEAVAVFDEITAWIHENGVPSNPQGLQDKLRRLGIELGAVRMEHSSYRGLWGAVLKELFPTRWPSRQHVADHVGASNKVLRTWREKVSTLRQRRGEGMDTSGRLIGPSVQSRDERPEQATAPAQPWLRAPGQQPGLCGGTSILTEPYRVSCYEDNIDAACTPRRRRIGPPLGSTATAAMPSLLQLSLPPAAMTLQHVASSSTTGAAARSAVPASMAGAATALPSAGVSHLAATVAWAAGAADMGKALPVPAGAGWAAPPVAWAVPAAAWVVPPAAWAASLAAWAVPPAPWAAQPAVWAAQPAAWAMPAAEAWAAPAVAWAAQPAAQPATWTVGGAVAAASKPATGLAPWGELAPRPHPEHVRQQEVASALLELCGGSGCAAEAPRPRGEARRIEEGPGNRHPPRGAYHG